MRLVIDLDDTICYPNHNETDTYLKYRNAKPNYGMISAIRNAKKSGHEIVIYTARRMITHNGDFEKIHNDVGEITKTWLDTYGVLYDELHFGKPYGDMYVDDKATAITTFVGLYGE